jgi:hypothetical protein
VEDERAEKYYENSFPNGIVILKTVNPATRMKPANSENQSKI